MLSALGAYKTYDFLTKRFNFKISFTIISLVILVFFGNFLHFYFFRYPVLSQEGNFFSERLVAKYIDLNYQKNTPVEIYTTLSQDALNEATFFNFKSYPESFKFLEGCPKINPQGVWLLDSRLNCQIDQKNRLAIKNPKDAGSLYYIFNDQLCPGIQNTYKRVHLISDYDLATMDSIKFCSRWIFKE